MVSQLGGITAVRDGRYRLDRVIASGGMAVVSLGTDRDLGRPVAVKFLAEHLAYDQPFRQRFLREARMAARLGHPNIVQVYDVGEENGRPYIVMEYVAGSTVGDVLAGRGSLSPAETVDIGLQVCAGLEHAHGAGVVHRDVNLRNLLLRPDGLVKIADFGIARELDGTKLTQTGLVMGTLGYLAPELATGEHPASPSADLYSLGAVLYHLLTGRTPYAARSAIELVMKQRDEPVTPPSEVVPDVPPDLEAAVLRCLEPDPAARPDSASALGAELRDAIGERTTEPVVAVSDVQRHHGSTRPLTVADPPTGADARRISGRAWAAALLALLIVGFVVGLLLTRPSDSPSGSTDGGAPEQPIVQDARELAEWIREQAG